MITQYLDYDSTGIPVTLGNVQGVPYCAAWDVLPPRAFDPEAARRNGSPIDLGAFKLLLSDAALAWAATHTDL